MWREGAYGQQPARVATEAVEDPRVIIHDEQVVGIQAGANDYQRPEQRQRLWFMAWCTRSRERRESHRPLSLLPLQRLPQRQRGAHDARQRQQVHPRDLVVKESRAEGVEQDGRTACVAGRGGRQHQVQRQQRRVQPQLQLLFGAPQLSGHAAGPVAQVTSREPAPQKARDAEAGVVDPGEPAQHRRAAQRLRRRAPSGVESARLRAVAAAAGIKLSRRRAGGLRRNAPVLLQLCSPDFVIAQASTAQLFAARGDGEHVLGRQQFTEAGEQAVAGCQRHKAWL
jgi:hypothetical protein